MIKIAFELLANIINIRITIAGETYTYNIYSFLSITSERPLNFKKKSRKKKMIASMYFDLNIYILTSFSTRKVSVPVEDCPHGSVILNVIE